METAVMESTMAPTMMESTVATAMPSPGKGWGSEGER
jgi:hypothetical protein